MMKTRQIWLLALTMLAADVFAQSDTGESWSSFGPDRASGAFLNITRRHLTDQKAQGIAVDHKHRLLVLNEWDELSDADTDCAVTRHINDARLLDMSYTGPEELEATRHVAMNMGGSNFDTCSAIAADSLDRAVVVGSGDYGSGTLSGFIVRLDADGDYDTSFSSDGKFALKNLAQFSGLTTRLTHVAIAPNNKVLACGFVLRGSDRHMIAMRVTASGSLDTSFGGDGIVEPTFTSVGDDHDHCDRLVILPDGDVMLAGIASDALGADAFALARLNSDGSLDTGFSSDGKAVFGTGSQTIDPSTLVDLAYDPQRDRYLLACNVSYQIAAINPAGCVLAVSSSGGLDTMFADQGRKIVRFSDYGSTGTRDFGTTRLGRMLLRDDGDMYLLGTHDNSEADFNSYGASDVASMRLNASGNVTTTINGKNTYADRGVQFHSFSQVHQANRSGQSEGYAASQDRFADEKLIDATWYRGNLLLLADRPRYRDTVYDHDNDGVVQESGPDAPLIASINAERLFDADFDFDGIDVPVPINTPTIALPAGYGNYCSVSNPASPSSYGLLPQGVGSDPCQQFLDGNANLVIERAGIYSIAGYNQVIGTCSGGFITLRVGLGTTPFNQAFADSNGQSGCIFTAVPNTLKVFSRPYTGVHVGNAQAFNHDPYGIAMDVADFGQPTGPYDACQVDNLGRQRSIGNPNANPSTCKSDGSGVDEPAMDIPVTDARMAVSVGPGWVVMAVPRHVPVFSPAGNDPYQREVFVRHRIGTGRYAELFTTYYAHLQDTAVRRGGNVTAGSVLGQIGETGAAYGQHLHISVHRNKNLSWRKDFEFHFAEGAWDRDGRVSAVDPWGWSAPQGVDPWAWRFRNVYSNHPELDDAGSFSSFMWLNGEDPTLF